MAIYCLCSERRKSNVHLQTNEDVPEGVKYISYKDSLYERSAVPKADGAPDPYLWLEHEGAAEEGALLVNGKDLISKQDRPHTWERDAHRRALERGDVSPAELMAKLDALQAQVDAAVPAEDPRVAELEAENAELKAQLEAATANGAAESSPEGASGAGQETITS